MMCSPSNNRCTIIPNPVMLPFVLRFWYQPCWAPQWHETEHLQCALSTVKTLSEAPASWPILGMTNHGFVEGSFVW